MCGIAGFIDFKSRSTEQDIVSMIGKVSHRGPDGQRVSFQQGPDYSAGLGHARLSIIDLSTNGNQPMVFENLTITYNGELYNHNELKKNLIELGYKFSSTSDTEVVLKSVHKWGLKALEKFNGMFAFALLDQKKDTLTLVRDRVGVKPLYYFKSNDLFLFSSELGGITAHNMFEKKVSLEAVDTFFTNGFVEAPKSIYERVFHLEPGCFHLLDLSSGNSLVEKYWDLKKFYEAPKLDLSETEVVATLDDLITSSVEYRLNSDVPIGTFLSGGIDSSLVTSIASAKYGGKLQTFTLGFDQAIFDEAPLAKKVSLHCDTSHNEIYLKTQSLPELIEKILSIWSEPFGDTSAIPTAILSEFASKAVKVVFSADGGDELFAGYNKYDSITKKLGLSKSLGRFPFLATCNGLVEKLMEKSAYPSVNQTFDTVQNTLRLIAMERSDLIACSSYIYNSLWKQKLLDISADNLQKERPSRIVSDIDLMLYLDTKNYLPNNVLCKVDRATMAFGLEGREPLLDFRLVEFAAKLPSNYKIRRGEKKFFLKQLARNYLPEEIVNQPKRGFTPPISYWMRTVLMDFICDVLSEDRIRKNKFYLSKNVLQFRDDFFAGLNNDYRKLWLLFVFQFWLTRTKYEK